MILRLRIVRILLGLTFCLMGRGASSQGLDPKLLEVYGFYRFQNVACSPDGTKFALAYNQFIHIIDIETGTPLRVLKGHTQKVEALCFSGDGNLLLSGADDNLVKLWDVNTGHELQTMTAHTKKVLNVVMSADANRMLTYGSDGKIYLWDRQKTAPIQTFTYQGTFLAISPDGKMAAASGAKGTQVWEADTGKPLYTNTAQYGAVAIAADKSKVAIMAYQQIIVVSTANWSTICTIAITGSTGRISISFSADGQQLLATLNSTIGLYDINQAKCIQTYSTRNGYNYCYGTAFRQYAGKDNVITWTDTSEAMIEWNRASGTQLRNVPLKDYIPTRASFSANSRELIVDTNARTSIVELNNLPSPQYHLHSTGQALDLLPNGKWIRSATTSSNVTFFDDETSTKLSTIAFMSSSGGKFIYAPDGHRALFTSSYPPAELYDFRTGLYDKGYYGHMYAISWAEFSGNGRRLVTQDAKNVIKLWDTESENCLRTIDLSSSASYTIQVHPTLSADGNRLALHINNSSDKTNTITIQDAATGTVVTSWTLIYDGSSWVRFSADGKYLVTTHANGVVKIWDAATGKFLRDFSGAHTTAANAQFSPDGSKLLVYGDYVYTLWTTQLVNGADEAWQAYP